MSPRLWHNAVLCLCTDVSEQHPSLYQLLFEIVSLISWSWRSIFFQNVSTLYKATVSYPHDYDMNFRHPCLSQTSYSGKVANFRVKAVELNECVIITFSYWRMFWVTSIHVLPRLALHRFRIRTWEELITYVAEFLHHTRHISYLAAEAWRQSFQLSSDVEIPLWNTGKDLWVLSSHSGIVIQDASILQEACGSRFMSLVRKI